MAIWCCLLLIWANQLLYMRAALDYVVEQHIAYPGFTTPLSKLDPLREKLRQADDVVIISQGMSWNLHHEVAVWDTLLWDDVACVRTLLGDGYAVFPDHAFNVIIAPDAPAQPAHELYATAQPEHFPMRNGSLGLCPSPLGSSAGMDRHINQRDRPGPFRQRRNLDRLCCAR